MPWEEYKATYPRRAGDKPNRNVVLGESEFKTLAAERKDWFSTDNNFWRVRVVEYWYYDRKARGLASLSDGRVEWEDAIPAKLRDGIVDVREVIDKSVKVLPLGRASTTTRTHSMRRTGRANTSPSLRWSGR